ncbi:M12 family metallopeptidase [Microbacterium sp.]|uniref:M12 family metallopeptidase n=1 Tax=Microbacterium sp. TaxID=51671 RepID=UPI003C2984EC
MSNVRNDRVNTRWPNGVVPYGISAAIGAAGRAQISASMATWANSTQCRFVEHSDQRDFVFFHGDEDECASTSVGRAGGMQQIGCEYPLTPRMVAGSPLAVQHQGSDGQLDCVFAGADGAVYVMWTIGSSWADPVALTRPGTVPPGAPIALGHQDGTDQLDAMFVDANGVVNVMWVQGSGAWQGPVGLTPAGAALPGTAVALAHQGGDGQLDALFVDGNGVVNVMWVQGSGGWQGPVGLTPVGAAPAGAALALAHQGGDNQLDVLFVDTDGVINVMWVQGGGAWQGPVGLTRGETAPAGAALALAHQGGDDQLDLVFVDRNGVVSVMWVQGGGAWQGPVGLTPAGAALPRTAVTLANQGGDDQLDAVYVDGNGMVNVMWVVGGGAWQGPVGLTAAGAAPAGAPVAIGEDPSRLDAMIAGTGGVPIIATVLGLNPWSTFSPIDGGGWGLRAITHELGHVLGLFHEQQRPDRDSYLTYHPERVVPGKEHNFDIPGEAQPLGAYDYASIMHYGADAFSMPGAGASLDPPAGVTLGSPSPTAEDVLAVRYVYGQVTASGVHLAAAYQGSLDQLSVVFPDTLGGISVMWVQGGGAWAPPVQMAIPAGGIPDHAEISLSDQGGLGQLDAVFVDVNGVVNVMWVQGGGAWQGPVGLTPLGVAPAGAAVSLAHQGGDQLDAIFVDANGVVNVMWVQGGGAWQGPVALTGAGVGVPGTAVALAHQGSDQLDAVFVDANGVVNVMWVQGGGAWQGPVGLTSSGAAPAGAPVALDTQDGDGQLDALFVDANGVVNVMWVQGGGAWQGPVALTGAGVGVPGTAVALAHQGSDQLDAVFVDAHGVVNVMWVQGGGAWQGPVGLTSSGAAPPGAPVTLHAQGGDGQLDALFVDANGVVNVMWVQGGGAWQGPVGVS